MRQGNLKEARSGLQSARRDPSNQDQTGHRIAHPVVGDSPEASPRSTRPLLICYSPWQSGIISAVNGLRLEQSVFTWNHEAHGSFIRAECADVSLLFDSCARRWTLRIYKRRTSFGQPVTYEIAFKERYGPTVEQAVALANDILLVELQ
jgi:hypothetical protein